MPYTEEYLGGKIEVLRVFMPDFCQNVGPLVLTLCRVFVLTFWLELVTIVFKVTEFGSG